MDIEVKKTGEGVSVIVRAGMTIYRAHDLKEAFLEALREGPAVDLDLSGSPEMDSAGFQLLWMLKRKAQAEGKTLRVRHGDASRSVLDLFRMAEGFLS